MPDDAMTQNSGMARWPGRHVELPGVRLWVVDSGGTGTPLILLHANTGTVAAWESQIAAFSDAGYRVIAFDRRGWGSSMALPDTGTQPGSIAEDLQALVDELGIERFVLIGIAGGGFAALDFASWRPERLHKLVVAASNGQFAEPRMLDFYRRIAVPGLTGNPDLRPYLEVGVAYRAEDPTGFQRFIAMEHHARQEGAPAQPMRTPNTFDKITAIDVQTLVLMGGADMLAPPALMRTWAAHLPCARYVEIGDGGHSLNWERPAAFNAAVLDFLAA